jgi:hypothetical protein
MGLFASSSPVVDTNDRCVGLVKCAVGMGDGVGTLHTEVRCEAIVLFLFLPISFLSFCAEGVSRFCLRTGHAILRVIKQSVQLTLRVSVYFLDSKL